MAQAQSVDRWEYRGDVNLEYGGTWFDLSTWDDGYVTAVDVTDLDSAAGARGMVMIRRITILVDNKEINGKALESCGSFSIGILPSRIEIAEAVMHYGYIDTGYEEIAQLDPDEDTMCDGWTAEKRMTRDELIAYIESDYLT